MTKTKTKTPSKDGYDFGFDLVMNTPPEKLNTVTSEEKAHAKYSASGSDRWLSCPGSISLSENAPEGESSVAAEEGTRAHACLEFLLNNRKKINEAIKMAKKRMYINPSNNRKEREWDDDMIKYALIEIQWVLDKAKTLPGSTIGSESRVDASSFTMPGQFGTLDIEIAQEFGRLVIYDYKYGKWPVEPEENSQGIYYALAKAEEYGFNFAEVEIVIGQPRAFHSVSHRRSWVVSMDYLLDTWAPRFKKGVEACEDFFTAPLISGDHCKFCPAKVICPEISNKALRNAQVVFDDDKGEIESLPVVRSLGIKNLPTILEACDQLEQWIKSVREHAFHVLEKKGAIKGYKLVEKRGIRKWENPAQVEKEARKKFGMAVFSEPELLSPNQIEEKFKSDKKKIVTVKDWIAKNTTQKSSGFTMTKEDDKREAVNYIDTVFKDDVFLPTSEIKKQKKGVRKMNENEETTINPVETTTTTKTIKVGDVSKTTKKVVTKPMAKAKGKVAVKKKVVAKKTAKKPTKKVTAKKKK